MLYKKKTIVNMDKEHIPTYFPNSLGCVFQLKAKMQSAKK